MAGIRALVADWQALQDHHRRGWQCSCVHPQLRPDQRELVTETHSNPLEREADQGEGEIVGAKEGYWKGERGEYEAYFGEIEAAVLEGRDGEADRGWEGVQGPVDSEDRGDGQLKAGDDGSILEAEGLKAEDTWVEGVALR